MKINTFQLSGLALDWAVAKSEKIDFVPNSGYDGIGNGFIATRFSEDYVLGGPLMLEHGISTLYDSGSACRKPSWFATYESSSTQTSYEGESFDPTFMVCEDTGVRGPTQLVAAMRCLVLKELGPIVDVPTEFLA